MAVKQNLEIQIDAQNRTRQAFDGIESSAKKTDQALKGAADSAGDLAEKMGWIVDKQGRYREANGRFVTAAKQQAAGLGAVGSNAKAAGLGIAAMGGAITLAGAAFAVVGREVLQFGVNAGAMASKVDAVRVAFNSLAAKGGRNPATVFNEITRAARGTLSDLQIMVLANQAMNTQVESLINNIGQVASDARAIAATLGADAEDFTQRFVAGVAKRERELLDEMGILVDARKANDAYARSIGKSADALNDQERTAAFAAEAIEQLRLKASLVGDPIDEQAEATKRLSAQWENLQGKLGVFLEGPAGGAFGFIADALSKLNREMETGEERLRRLSATQAELSVASIRQGLVDIGAARTTNAEALQEANPVNFARGVGRNKLGLSGRVPNSLADLRAEFSKVQRIAAKRIADGDLSGSFAEEEAGRLQRIIALREKEQKLNEQELKLKKALSEAQAQTFKVVETTAEAQREQAQLSVGAAKITLAEIEKQSGIAGKKSGDNFTLSFRQSLRTNQDQDFFIPFEEVGTFSGEIFGQGFEFAITKFYDDLLRGEGLKQSLENLGGGITDALTTELVDGLARETIDLFKPITTEAKAQIASMADTGAEIGKKFVGGIADAFTDKTSANGQGSVPSALKRAFDVAGNSAGGAVSGIAKAGEDAGGLFVAGVNKAFTGATSANGLGGAKSPLESAFDVAVNSASGAGELAASAMATPFGSSFKGKIEDRLTAVFGNTTSPGGFSFNPLSDTIKRAIPDDWGDDIGEKMGAGVGAGMTTFLAGKTLQTLGLDLPDEVVIGVSLADTGISYLAEGSDEWKAVSDNFNKAILAGVAAGGIASLFSPDGRVGAELGAAVGSLFFDAIGAAVGGSLGSIIDTLFFGESRFEQKMQKFAASQLQAVLVSTGGVEGLIKEAGGAGGVGEFLVAGGFAQAAHGIIQEDFLRSGLVNALIATGKTRTNADQIVDRIVSGGYASAPPSSLDDLFIDSDATYGDAAGDTPTPVVPTAPAAGKPVAKTSTFTQVEKTLVQSASFRAFSKSALKMFGWPAVANAINALADRSVVNLQSFGPQLKALITGRGEGFPSAGAAEHDMVANGYDIIAAKGYQGIVNKPTSMLVGEAGPEAVNVTPLNKGYKGGGRNSGGGAAYYFTFNVNTLDSRNMKQYLEQEVYPSLRQLVLQRTRQGDTFIDTRGVR